MIIDYLTGALVIITGFYAWAALRIFRANEKVVEVMHEQDEGVTRPYVSVAPVVEPEIQFFTFVIKGVGDK